MEGELICKECGRKIAEEDVVGNQVKVCMDCRLKNADQVRELKRQWYANQK